MLLEHILKIHINQTLKRLLDFVNKVHTPHASDPCHYHEPTNTITWKSIIKSISDSHQLFFFRHGHIQHSFVTCMTDWQVLQVTHSHIHYSIHRIPMKKFLTLLEKKKNQYSSWILAIFVFASWYNWFFLLVVNTV